MDRRSISGFGLLAGIFLLVILAAALGAGEGMQLFALPFVLLGQLLRQLSLSGSGGNVLALILYTCLCLLPLCLALGRIPQLRDLLLPLTSGACFWVMYYMINPLLRPVILRNAVGDAVLAGAIWSLLLAWLILGLIRPGDRAHTWKALRLLVFLCVLGLAGVAAQTFGGFLDTVEKVRRTNTMPGLTLWPTYGFAFLRFALTLLECALDGLLLLRGSRLLERLQADPYSEEACAGAGALAGLCRRNLVILAVSAAAVNLAQVLASPVLHDLSVTVQLPLVSIALAFGLLCLTELLHRGTQIRRDNDLFI